MDKKIDSSRSVVYNLLANLENRNQWDSIAYQANVELNKDNTKEIFGWSVGDTKMGEVRVKNAEKVSSISRQNFKGISKVPTRV